MNFIKNFNKLSLDIKNYINIISNQKKFRNRKTSLFDGIIFKLLYTMEKSTQDYVTCKLNLYNNNNASRKAYIKRIDNMDVSIFEKIYTYLNKQILYYFGSNNNNNDCVILAVDGTYIQLKEKLADECKRIKNTSSVTCLVTGIFNITYNTPEILKFENNETSERKSFINIFNNIKNTYMS